MKRGHKEVGCTARLGFSTGRIFRLGMRFDQCLQGFDDCLYQCTTNIINEYVYREMSFPIPNPAYPPQAYKVACVFQKSGKLVQAPISAINSQPYEVNNTINIISRMRQACQFSHRQFSIRRNFLENAWCKLILDVFMYNTERGRVLRWSHGWLLDGRQPVSGATKKESGYA